MNLCFINTRTSWAGGENWFLWAACEMARRGHRVTMAVSSGSELGRRAVDRDIPIRSLTPLTPFSIQLRKIFGESGFDVVICNNGREARASVIARWGIGLPKIVLRRGLCRDIGRGFLKDRLYSRLDGFIFNSRATADIVMEAHSWLSEDSARIMYNPAAPPAEVPEDRLEDAREAFRTGDGDVVIASVGRLDADKGHSFLLRAFKKVLRSDSGVRLLIAGEGPERKALEELSAKLGMTDNVVFCGFCEEPAIIYSLADVLVMPSMPGYESFSNAALEAMAHSVPVVATNVGGFAEMINDGENGFLVPSCNVEEMARILDRLIKDEGLRSRMGKNAGDIVNAHFRPEDKADELSSYLESLGPVKQSAKNAMSGEESRPEEKNEGRQPVSCCIVAQNEEHNIGDCLESVSWADEIVVVDGMSTDSTQEIAGRYTDRIIEHEFEGHVEQKNYAAEQASNNWVLSIDADERVTPELKQEILQALMSPGDISAYFMPRMAYYLGRPIRHSGWYPDRKLRLFRKDRAGWGGRNPHDHIETDGRTAQLRGDLLHYTYRDVSDHIKRINSYTSIAAEKMAEEGRTSSLSDILFRGPFKFVKMYVLKAGFLDGYAGFVLAVASGFYVFMKYVKLREISKSGE